MKRVSEKIIKWCAIAIPLLFIAGMILGFMGRIDHVF